MTRRAGTLNGFSDMPQVVIEHGVQQRLLVAVALVERADRDPGTRGDPHGGEPVRPGTEQNLNRRLLDGLHGDARTRLDRRLSWLECRNVDVRICE